MSIGYDGPVFKCEATVPASDRNMGEHPCTRRGYYPVDLHGRPHFLCYQHQQQFERDWRAYSFTWGWSR